MKKTIALLAACAILTGCHIVPTFHSPISFDQKPAVNQTTTAPALTPVQQVVKVQVRWFIGAGILCLLAAGALIYFGMYLPALKVGLAGILLPIFAAWFSVHYAWIIAGSLISLAVWYVVTHAALQKALADFAEKQAKTASKNL